MTIGYFGVIVPSRRFWQGYNLIEPYRKAGETFLKNFRENVEGICNPPSAVLHPLHDTKADDQPLIGAISAAVVEMSLNGTPDQVGVISTALHLLLGERFFLVMGYPENAGIRTEVLRLSEATSASDVRRHIMIRTALLGMRA